MRRRLLLLGVALLWPGHLTGIDDLPTHGEMALVLEHGVEAGKELVDPPFLSPTVY
jgi:hypothetical protein